MYFNRCDDLNLDQKHGNFKDMFNCGWMNWFHNIIFWMIERHTKWNFAHEIFKWLVSADVDIYFLRYNKWGDKAELIETFNSNSEVACEIILHVLVICDNLPWIS